MTSKLACVTFFIFMAAAMVSAAPVDEATLSKGQAVPVNDVPQKELRRQKRHFAPQYVSPCAAAASNPHPAIAPAYHVPVPVAPVQAGYIVPHHYRAYVPHYRDDMAEEEMMSFSDMDQMMSFHPMERYAYAPAPISSAAHTPSRPAFAVFPNAEDSGCGVPLMFSCSPSIVQGSVVQAHPQNAYVAAHSSNSYASAPAPNAYREIDEAHPLDIHTQHEELPQEHITAVHETNPASSQHQ